MGRAVGSAPGLIADLWLEFRWLNCRCCFSSARSMRVSGGRPITGRPLDRAVHDHGRALDLFRHADHGGGDLPPVGAFHSDLAGVAPAGYKKTTLTMVPAVAPEAEDLVAA